jgi:hypothetical protein
VYDVVKKCWDEDDHEVIGVRAIGELEARELLTFVTDEAFSFDFDKFDYFFVTSQG